MTQAFRYRPRFKDIRIKPPKDEPRAQEKVCEYPKCTRKAEARAPKDRDRLHEYYWFCQNHAGEYNKSWNFFEGMSESAARTYQDSQHYGHRPTWNFAAASRTRKRAENASVDWQKAFFDPHAFFGDRPPPGHERATPSREGPRPGRLQEKALDELGLEFGSEKGEVRKRYAELVRTYHPDSNGGDRTYEDRLQKVVAAYQILKSAGMA